MLRLLKIGRKFRKTRSTLKSENENMDQRLAKESDHFLNIFPELVWKCIAKHLDCSDFHNLINSSPFFRSLFKDARVQRLFKNVFEIFQYHQQYNQQKESMKLIFNCRLACRAWNNALCDLVQKQFLENITDNQNLRKRNFLNVVLRNYKLKTFEEVNNYVKKFESCIFNPFFGKSVFLFVPPICEPDTSNSRNQKFYDTILFLLEVFGKFVYNCEIHLSSEERSYIIDSEETYLNLMELLWTMPNLKNLRIFQFSKVLVFDMTNVRMPPTFRRLESLELHSVSRCICEEIVRKNLHVRWLLIHQSFDSERRGGYLMYHFENLEHLELKHYNWSDIYYLKDNCVDWKLKSLKLNFYVNDDGKGFFRVNCFTVWADIFNILSKRFGETLEDLRLELPEMSNERNRSMVAEYMLNFRLNFPKLKKIDLLVGSYSPVDFLLGLSGSLEVLIITFSLSDHTAIKNLLQVNCPNEVIIYSCFCEKCLSKLWKLFPKLKTVKMRDSQTLKFNRPE